MTLLAKKTNKFVYNSASEEVEAIRIQHHRVIPPVLSLSGIVRVTPRSSENNKTASLSERNAVRKLR